MPAGPAGSTTYAVDALILGAGSLGMWVLHRLNQDGVTSCVAIDPHPPGSGQTTHSHAFLHDGFVYRNSDGVLFRDSVQSWQQWLPAMSASPRPSVDLRWSNFAEHVDAHPAYAPVSDYERWAKTRGHPAVANRYSANNCAQCVHPSGGAWPGVVTKEQSLDSSLMLDQFRRQYSSQVLRGDVLDIDVVNDQGQPRVDSVTIDPMRGDGARITIQPRFVVCCAGSGNEQLLQRLRVSPQTTVPTSLQNALRPGAMQHSEPLEVICVRNAQGPNLPLHNGAIGRHPVANASVGLTLNAQIVSRVDGNGRVVWVFNGSLSGPGAGKVFAGQQYRRIMVNEMCHLFGTSLGQVRQSAEWGTYLAPLTILTQGRAADLFRGPRNDTYETLGLDGFAVAYVDRLTLAPVVAEELLNLMAPTLSQGGVGTAATVPGLTAHPQSAVETWTTPQTWHTGGWQSWTNFQPFIR